AVLIAAMCLAIFVIWVLAKRTAPLKQVVTQRRPTVAVLGFQNLSGQSEAGWLSTALTEMLGTELSAGEHLQLVASQDVARARNDLSITQLDGVSAGNSALLRRNLGADL